MKLTEKQQKFVDFYLTSGNADESARKAGYSTNTARGHAHKLLQNVAVKKAIEKRNNMFEAERIADMEEVKQYWTNVLRDNEEDPKHRLKASEYIAKTNGAFLEKVEHSGPDGGPIHTQSQINLAALSDEELKSLESIISKTSDTSAD